ncbi:hypothetical protein G5I_03714 [Acromyrmex echinatior]|uniref:Uncharacterized protein n=1 Tax=Acromyrmex echinatior TaxID=103372 RepID=F4WDQ6_ACREC|nr:hypothetical protein G5I_03714 [Acromyrmex echinatior]
MIGAMPAVAVRHERRRQEKRLKRPSQLYLGGQWLPPLQGSPPTPSPHGHNNLEPLPELYLCGKLYSIKEGLASNALFVTSLPLQVTFFNNECVTTLFSSE